MCSVDTDSLQEMIPVISALQIGSDVDCRKCGVKPVEVILKKTDPYCRDCFLSYATHKFRSCLGKHKQVPAGASVLIGTSGGLASSALLHMVHCGVTLDSLKKLRIVPTFLHVDESSASCYPNEFSEGCPAGETEGHMAAEAACRAVLRLGYPCYYTTVEATLASSKHTLAPVLLKEGCSIASARHRTSSPALRSQLQTLLTSCGSATARESVLRVLVQRALTASCLSLDHSRLFVGHSSTQVASTILASMAEGRGAHIPDAVGFIHKDVTGVAVIRPLRELLEEELLHYLALHSLPYTEHRHTNDSIWGCTHNFLAGLQENFPSTIPTVFRTGDKLLAYDHPTNSGTSSRRSSTALSTTSLNSLLSNGSPPSQLPVSNGDSSESAASGGALRASGSDNCCGLCRGVIDTNQPEASAMQATIISQKFSKRPMICNVNSLSDVEPVAPASSHVVPDVEAPVHSNANTDEGLDDEAMLAKYQDLITKEDLNSLLCYGCRITLHKMEEVSLLPQELQLRACKAVQQRLAAAGVAQFLL